jgi:hypothetical protein
MVRWPLCTSSQSSAASRMRSIQHRNRRHKQSVLVAFEDNREAAKLPSLLHANPLSTLVILSCLRSSERLRSAESTNRPLDQLTF